ncbi:MAG: YaeQ family protein [Pseudomonadales bacterium]
MALKATIFKADVDIADIDHGYYQSHSLTVARHPSETDERMMVRILAFALNAAEEPAFTRGISNDDEPDLWHKDLSGTIVHWIETGLPDAKRIRKACNQSQKVTIYAYGRRSLESWWQQNEKELKRYKNLRIISLLPDHSEALTTLVTRTMKLQCTMQDDGIWLTNGTDSVEVSPHVLYPL